MTDRARTGWDSSFAEFREAQPKRIRERLVAFIRDASPEQIRSWDDSMPPLQAEVSKETYEHLTSAGVVVVT